MGIVAGWLHVGRDVLESVPGQHDWTAAKLEKALEDKGLDTEHVSDVVYAYAEHDEPNPDWNDALARLTEVKRFDLDKTFTRDPSLVEVVARIPGAKPLLDWTSAQRPALTLVPP